jgi:catechol 2,3-dioxygenase-like lactoylglutathione lyase family enzyme
MAMERIRHVGIVVSDIEKSLKFYCEVFGLKKSVDTTIKGNWIDSFYNAKGVNFRSVKLTYEKGEEFADIELLYYPLDSQYAVGPKTLFNSTHIAFVVDDADKIHNACLAMGGKCNSAPLITPDGNYKAFFCQDPDGNYLEINQFLFTPGKEVHLKEWK